MNLSVINVLAGFLIVLASIKLIVVFVSPQAWLRFVRRVYAVPTLTSTIALLLAALVLFRAAVMIETEEHAARGPGARAEVDSRLAAVAADLENRPEMRVRPRQLVQAKTFLVVEKPLARQGYGMSSIIHCGLFITKSL